LIKYVTYIHHNIIELHYYRWQYCRRTVLADTALGTINCPEDVSSSAASSGAGYIQEQYNQEQYHPKYDTPKYDTNEKNTRKDKHTRHMKLKDRFY